MHTDPRHRVAELPDAANRDAASGMPQAAELLQTYLAGRAEQVEELSWFLGYCHYKSASAIAALVKQNRRKAHASRSIQLAGETLPQIIDRGLELLDSDDFLS
jgi:aminoglycoside phosphotransferase (APT) family kinase protein